MSLQPRSERWVFQIQEKIHNHPVRYQSFSLFHLKRSTCFVYYRILILHSSWRISLVVFCTPRKIPRLCVYKLNDYQRIHKLIIFREAFKSGPRMFLEYFYFVQNSSFFLLFVSILELWCLSQFSSMIPLGDELKNGTIPLWRTFVSYSFDPGYPLQYQEFIQWFVTAGKFHWYSRLLQNVTKLDISFSISRESMVRFHYTNFFAVSQLEKKLFLNYLHVNCTINTRSEG